MNEALNIIIQAVSGAFTGYITNTYAINMLFKEYTSLKIGGVIKKTKSEFIENVSALVERDIINHETLQSELSKDAFKDSLEKLINDFLKVSLYDQLGELTYGAFEGFEPTYNNTKRFIELQLKKNARKAIDTVCEEVSVDALLSEEQIEILLEVIIDELLVITEKNDFIADFVDDLLSEHGHLKAEDLIGKTVLDTVEANINSQLDVGIKHIKCEEYDTLEMLITSLLDTIDYQKIICDFQTSLFSKQISQIISSDNQVTLTDAFKENVIGFLKSDEGKKLFESLVSVFIKLGKNIDKTLLDLISPEFRPSVKAYLKKNLPTFIKQISGWIKEHASEIESLIQDAVNETIDSTGGPKGVVLKIIKKVFLSDIASKNEVANLIVSYLQDEIDIEELSETLTLKAMNFFEEETVRSMIISLEKSNMLSEAKIADFIIKNMITSIDYIPKESLEQFFNKKLDELVKIDLVKIFDENIKSKAVTGVVNLLISGSRIEEMASVKFKRIYSDIKKTPFDEFLKAEKMDAFASMSKEKLVQKITQEKSEIIAVLTGLIKSAIADVKINTLLPKGDIRNIENQLSTKAYDAVINQIDARKSSSLKDDLDKLNNIVHIDELATDFVIKQINRNLEVLLEGNIKRIVGENLSKLSDDEISEMVHNFMGKELQPITISGAFLGLFAGVALALFTEGKPLTKFSFNPYSIVTFAVVGLLTNVLALELIFRPYKEQKLLANIPGLNLFSQGYIVKNKEAFAKNMAGFVDEDLLDKKMINESFISHRSAIKEGVLDSISKDNYEVASFILNKHSVEISEQLTDWLVTYVKSEAEMLSNEIVKYTENIRLSEAPVREKSEAWSKWLIAHIHGLKINAINQLDNFLQSDYEILSLLDDKETASIKEMIVKEVSTVLESVIVSVCEGSYIEKAVASYGEQYKAFIAQSMQEVIDRNVINDVKGHISGRIEDLITSDDARDKLMQMINDKFNHEFSPQKRVGDLFDGKIKNYVNQNINTILGNIKDMLVDSLKENEGLIQRKVKSIVKGELGSIQKGAYLILGGDDVIDRVISKLVYQKFPSYIDKSQNQIKDIFETLMNKHIYPTKVSEIQLKISEKNVASILEGFVSNKHNLNTIAKSITQISNAMIIELTLVPMQRYLEIMNLETLDLVYQRFKQEVDEVSSVTANELRRSKVCITNDLTKVLYKFFEKYILDIEMADVFDDVDKKDIEEFVDTAFRHLTKSEAVSDALNLLINEIYQNGYQDKSLHQVIQTDTFKKDVQQTVSDLVYNERIEAVINEIIASVISKATDKKLDFVHAKTKHQIAEVLTEASLDSVKRQIADILMAVDFRNITENKINELDAKAIHTLFNSFAGKYFTKLKLYGLWGGVFGLHSLTFIFPWVYHLYVQLKNGKGNAKEQEQGS
ncbi:DUF445 family protein [Fusibacter ferrireducens]|uniref:DUF445 family protein n=1 Tax=Fusibacter ferrireducens TaxID=2785058 RepID=A0ABR9ZWT8_9FIRM|nr:DUF445 family protein [Fusibacter ferrireducens]MBF4694933.1 DUF445 family protein [Fusibacter ferrireducens]